MQLEESPYATLEVARSASLEQIETAYHRLKGLLADGQLAAYGMLEPTEMHRQREQLDLAYDVLSDANKRLEYDQRHFGLVSPIEHSGSAGFHHGTPSIGHAPPPSSSARHARKGRLVFPCPLAETLPSDATFDGPLLRRLRESANAALEQFCDATKISRRYLKAIEADDFGLLPAPVYVRGFVSEYARLLGLDPKAVSESYMTRLSKR